MEHAQRLQDPPADLQGPELDPQSGKAHLLPERHAAQIYHLVAQIGQHVAGDALKQPLVLLRHLLAPASHSFGGWRLPDGCAKAVGWDVLLSQEVLLGHFRHIGLAMMMHTVAISTLTIHIMPFLSSINIPRSTASLVAMAVPLVSILGRISSGWLADRFNKILVATAFFLITFLGMLCLSYASSEMVWVLILFIILWGIGWGSNHTLRAAMLREYFGRSKFGSIFGLMMGLSAVGGIVGPLFAGWVFDSWASYQIAWLTLTSLAFVSVIIIATTPAPTTAMPLVGKR